MTSENFKSDFCGTSSLPLNSMNKKSTISFFVVLHTAAEGVHGTLVVCASVKLEHQYAHIQYHLSEEIVLIARSLV